MKNLLSILLYSCLLSVLSCTESEFEAIAPVLVVDGWIESDGYPTVLLTTTATPYGNGTNISDCVVRWGKVTISDGDTTVILTGSVDNRYFPPFVYRTIDMKGEVGKRYTLTAEYNGMKVSSTTQILPEVPIDSISISSIEGSDSLRSVKVFLTANENSNQYYKLRCRVYETDSVFYSSFLGTFSDKGNKGVISVPLYRGKHVTNLNKYVQDVVVGQHVEIKLCHIDEPEYNFWMDYDNSITFGTSAVLQSISSLRSNINGGYGTWCGYGISRYSFIVSD